MLSKITICTIQIKFKIFCAILCFGSQSISAVKSSYFFDAITNDKGLTHNTVFDICQDSLGFMWFATDGGLNRFDGRNIKQYYALKNNNLLPSNSVPCIIYTTDFQLFVGTSNGLARYVPEKDNFKQLLFKGEPIGDIIAIKQGIGSELLISTENAGAFIYNYKKNLFTPLTFLKDRIFGMTADKEGYYWAFSRFSLYRFNKFNKISNNYFVNSTLFNSAISHIMSDSKGILWVGTFEKGLFTYNFNNNKFSPVTFTNGTEMYYIRTIEEGNSADEYWVGTEKGLFIFNIKTGYIQHFVQSIDKSRKTLNDNAIYKIFKNKQKVIFIGTYFGGVNISKTRNLGFEAIFPNEKPNSLQGKALSSIAKAPDGKIWIATEDAGIAILNTKDQTFRHLFSSQEIKITQPANNIHALLMDKDDCWVGHFMGGLSKVNIKTGHVKRFIGNVNIPFSLNNNFVFSLLNLFNDSILVGTIAGIELFDKNTEKFTRFRENELNDCFVYDMFTAPDGKVWICTYNKGIFILEKNRRGLMSHFKAGDNSHLTSNSIISHCIDSKKQIWIGTRGNGLCRFDSKKNIFETIQKKEMLIDNVVYGILEDNKGLLWISTNKGISRLNFRDSTATHFNFKHGIAGNQYNYKSYFKDTDGTMYFGSVNGLTKFKPEEILTPKVRPTTYFSNFKIFNEIILPDGKIIDKQIDFCDKINLKYNQNSFAFEFASINYFEGDIAYEYFLEGFDEKWSPLTEKMQANYTNISPGKYVFHIRANNRISNITGNERTLIIEIAPPFWASKLAYFLYLVFVGAVSFLLYRNYQNRQAEKVALTIEKIERENLNILHQHKMNFFTYISHEFKTPLSIIIASVEMLFKSNDKQGAETLEMQNLIKRSATRLLFLVNQLMEFRKIETDHAVLNITKANIVDFTNQIIGVYRPLLSKKNIDLKVQMYYTEIELLFDFDKFEKILTNLLTNAVKFTPQYGQISFSLNINPNAIEFSVKDSGKGLDELQKEKIFEVFYSDDISNELVESSGIGLALTASLVKLLKGEITVESESGNGCKFIVNLPITTERTTFNEVENHVINNNLKEIINTTETEIHQSSEVLTVHKEFSIVIAEDNKDLLLLLNKHFKYKYKVKCFENGKNAWEHIANNIPDVVITDIMMPMMSGTELCSKIKTDINLCHIPVVMLTAKTTPEAKIEGLQIGADIYMTKPFSMNELDIQINNILNNRRFLKNKLKDLAHFEGLIIPSTNHELAFIEKLYDLILNNIENSELNVQFLANLLNISRTNLHNKLKQTLQVNTTEFINTIRINKAKELILIKELNFSQIAYRVGFSDVSYFNRTFKKITGKTPGDYLNDYHK